MAAKEATSASGRVTHLGVGERRALGSQAADQNEQDYEEFVKAIRSGRPEAVEGV